MALVDPPPSCESAPTLMTRRANKRKRHGDNIFASSESSDGDSDASQAAHRSRQTVSHFANDSMADTHPDLSEHGSDQSGDSAGSQHSQHSQHDQRVAPSYNSSQQSSSSEETNSHESGEDGSRRHPTLTSLVGKRFPTWQSALTAVEDWAEDTNQVSFNYHPFQIQQHLTFCAAVLHPD